EIVGRRVRQYLDERPAQRPGAAARVDRDEFDLWASVCRQLDQRQRLRASLFVERKRQWRPRVADMVSADGLLPVQVSECHAVRAGEEVDRHGLDTADEAAQGAFATAGIAATHKGVRGHDPSCTVRYVGARRGELDAEDILGALDVWVGEGFACGELVA